MRELYDITATQAINLLVDEVLKAHPELTKEAAQA